MGRPEKWSRSAMLKQRGKLRPFVTWDSQKNGREVPRYRREAFFDRFIWEKFEKMVAKCLAVAAWHFATKIPSERGARIWQIGARREFEARVCSAARLRLRLGGVHATRAIRVDRHGLEAVCHVVVIEVLGVELLDRGAGLNAAHAAEPAVERLERHDAVHQHEGGDHGGQRVAHLPRDQVDELEQARQADLDPEQTEGARQDL